MQDNQRQERVTAFDWQAYAQPQERPRAAGERGGKRTQRQQRPLSASERAQRILANRWGSPYSKPGVPSRSGF